MSKRKRSSAVTTLDPEFVELVDRYRDRVALSVSDLEVAVMIEASGIGDSDATRHGCRDVFELATRIRAVVGRDPSVRRGELPDWFGSTSTALIRGMTYVLAGVMSMAAARQLHDAWAAPVLLSVNVTATGLMHALSYLSHLVTARTDPSARRATLRPVLRWSIVLAAAVGLIVGFLNRPLLGVVASLPVVYVASAVVLLVLGRQWRVISCIVPGGALCLLTLVAPRSWMPPAIAFSVAGAGLVLMFCTAWYDTRGKVKGRAGAIGLLDLRAASDHLAAGLALAGVVGANLLVLTAAHQLRHASPKQWLILALPFFMPLVSAEALVIVFRRGLRQRLVEVDDPAEFRRAAWRATMRLWGTHLALGAIAIGLTIALDPIHRSPAVWAAMVAFLATSTLLLFCLLAGVSGRERMIVGFLAPAILLLVGARLGSHWLTVDRALEIGLVVLVLAAIGFAARLAAFSARLEAFR